MEQILATSRENNQAAGITGVLLYADGNIIQVLEGEEPSIRKLYDRIAQDDRHRGAMVLLQEQIDERAFPDWSMGFKQISNKAIRAMDGMNEYLDKTADNLTLNRTSVQILLNNFRRMVNP